MPVRLEELGDEGARETRVRVRNVGLWVLVATILGSSMAFIDGSVINVALPVIQKELNATATDVQWIVEAYSLFLSALILVGGSLGDLFGRRRVFGIGVTGFILASLWCGFAPNVLQLIIARAIQGIGAALLVPGSLAIISASFSDEQRGRAIGTWSGFTAITSVVGPVLGGIFVQYISWRWVFFINIPLAVIVLFVLFWGVPESRDELVSRKLDWWGTLLVVIGLGSLVYGLIEAGGTSLGRPIVLISLVIGVLALGGFLLVEARSISPMVPLTLFRSPTLSGTNILTFLLYGALGAFTFFLPFNLIQVQGYSPLFAGMAMVPFILLLFIFSRWAGGLVNRYGAKLPLIIGPTIVALSFALFAVQGITTGEGSYWYTFFPAILLLGAGMTITVAPLTTAVMGSVEERHAGIASGINNAVSRTAGLLAIAILGIVALSVFNSQIDNHLASLHLTPALQQTLDAQRVKMAGISIPPDVSVGTRAALKRAINESFVSSFSLIMFVCAGLALVSALSAWLLVEDKRSTETGPEPSADMSVMSKEG